MNLTLNGIELSVFSSRLDAVCDEMGSILQRSAFSPNIKDRLDFSCAVFDCGGKLSAQAAHIPVHLGSMAFAMEGIVSAVDWQPGDMLVVNDPFQGGTHLPDVTLVAPVFVESELLGFVANRAHHASIGSESPGSMPISSHIEQEGVLIAPQLLLKQGEFDDAVLVLLEDLGLGDFIAQVSANRSGVLRLEQLILGLGIERFGVALEQLNTYGAQLAREYLGRIPDGCYRFRDVMDDDGLGNSDLPIEACVEVCGEKVSVDFAGTSAQVEGNINCPLPVTAAAVYYVFRCLLPDYTPACAGVFGCIELRVAKACMLNAVYPAAVAAGNVETSSRIVDVVLGALAEALPDLIPAASQGTMNNIAMGVKGRWEYYETVGGGMGAGSAYEGLHGSQSHMTNTLNTPIESLEMHFPLRIRRYQLRRGSGGSGLHPGGSGLLREFEFLENADATLISERRRHQPWGLAGGEAGQSGHNTLNGKPVDGKVQLKIKRGDSLKIETPGGGGWGV